MPKVDKAWCPYCVIDALVHFAILGLTVPETLTAIGSTQEGADARTGESIATT